MDDTKDCAYIGVWTESVAVHIPIPSMQRKGKAGKINNNRTGNLKKITSSCPPAKPSRLPAVFPKNCTE